MRCPRCGFDGEQVDSACARCGYRRVSAEENRSSAKTPGTRAISDTLRGVSGPLSSPPLSLREISGQLRSPSMPLRDGSGPLRSPSMPLRDISGPLRSPSMPLRDISGPLRPLTSASRSLSLYTAKSGDTLNQGRYRLIDQLVLPDNQQGQGAAWLAVDTLAGQMQVVVREVVVPAEEQVQKPQIVRQVALRISEGAQHSGFPRLLDVFNELDNYFIVFQHVWGENLASLLRRQGGALPERTVAEYGRQLCEMLAALAQQPQPLVHGAISPETVVVSPDRSRVHLIHLPLFPPRESPTASTVTGYKAPEQAREPATPASDLYSVAATMHHAVTGFNPRERIAFFYPPARRLNPLVSQQMENILAQELRLASQQRYARAADMQADLITLLATKDPEAEKKPPMSVGDPLKEGTLSLRQQSRKRSRVQLGIFGAICLLILAALLFAYFSPLFKNTPITSPPKGLSATATATALQNALNSEWQAEAPLYQSKGIGISDGRYVFDTYSGRSTVEVNEKKEAAQALLANNTALALQDYGLAVTNDKTDAEARIYYEDVQIAAQKDPFVTVVLGLPLDENPADLALSRSDMQAAFAFQYQVNTQNSGPLPGGAKLRLLIANSGPDTLDGSNTDDGNVATVAQFISRRVAIGNPDHILAVVGWPKSQESENAITVLTTAQIPLLAPTASAPALSGISPYFFHISPTAAVEGQAQAQFAYQVLKARKVMVMSDPNDPYSQALAAAFNSSFQQLGGNPDTEAAYNFSEGKTTVAQFEQTVAQDALYNHDDLIYLPGLDVDAVRLAHALGEESRAYGWSSYMASLKILGDDNLDSSMLLGQGTDPDAQLAQNYPQDMQRLFFTSFANSAEGGSQLQSMLTNWSKLYAAASGSSPTVPVPDGSAILTNDAFGVLIDALGQVSGPLTGANLCAALTAIGTGNIKPYQGASGQIAFNGKGDPINKTLVLLEVVPNGSGGQNAIKFVAASS